jgi:lysophospholipase L1-like esterase
VARQAGLKVIVCTLSPWNAFESAPGVVAYTPTLDSVRLQVNSYLRTSTEFDGIIDFDAALRDPANPTKLRPEWDSGDHIHPNDAGNEAMAKAVPLDLLLADDSDED